MYLVIGKENCSRCEMVKNILLNKNIEFEYKKLEELPEEEGIRYKKLGREYKQLSFPLIIKDNKVYDLKEVI
jgi:glutaredoxin